AVVTVSLRGGVILGGVFTIACGLAAILFMPEPGFVRRPREERAAPIAELRRTAVKGGRYAWAQPIVMLLIGVELFMGTSSEAFDRLKEAHFLRDIGLPAVGQLDPVVWFGIFWLAGMVLNIAAIGSLIKRVERGSRQTIAQFLFAFTLMQLAAMLVFALTGSVWVAIAGLLGVFFARNMALPLWDTWLNQQITDSSVRATVISLTGQSNAVGQAGGGPVLGGIGNVWGIRAALGVGALAIAPALALYARAIAHHGRELSFEGHLKSFAVTPSEIEAALDDGMGFDGSSITGFNAIEESDMVAIPDPETFTPMPWKEGETKVARMICDVVTPDGAPYEGDPRYVLHRALERMRELGCDTFNVGPELEYFLF